MNNYLSKLLIGLLGLLLLLACTVDKEPDTAQAQTGAGTGQSYLPLVVTAPAPATPTPKPAPIFNWSTSAAQAHLLHARAATLEQAKAGANFDFYLPIRHPLVNVSYLPPNPGFSDEFNLWRGLVTFDASQRPAGEIRALALDLAPYATETQEHYVDIYLVEPMPLDAQPDTTRWQGKVRLARVYVNRLEPLSEPERVDLSAALPHWKPGDTLTLLLIGKEEGATMLTSDFVAADKEGRYEYQTELVFAIE